MPHEDDAPAKITVATHPDRLRRETGRDRPFGTAIRESAAEADNRVIRSMQGPPPTQEEQELIRSSPRLPAGIRTWVTVTDLEDGYRETFFIVRSGEEDPDSNRISFQSPIGRAFYQEYPGAVVQVKAPGGARLYRILQVKEEQA